MVYYGERVSLKVRDPDTAATHYAILKYYVVCLLVATHLPHLVLSELHDVFLHRFLIRSYHGAFDGG